MTAVQTKLKSFLVFKQRQADEANPPKGLNQWMLDEAEGKYKQKAEDDVLIASLQAQLKAATKQYNALTQIPNMGKGLSGAMMGGKHPTAINLIAKPAS